MVFSLLMAINGVINNVLKTLKDFDFGKQSLENTINTEIDQMITKFTPRRYQDRISLFQLSVYFGRLSLDQE